MSFVLTVIKRSILFILFCFGAIILLEGSLRLAFINRSAEVPFVTVKEQADYVLRDKSTITLRPGKKHEGKWVVNKHGFRGQAFTSTENYRIIIYGDEMSFTSHLSEPESLGPVLTERTRASLRQHVDVMNASVPGLGPDQVLERLQRDIDTFKPDTVIVMVNTHNDYGDIVRNRRFYLDADNKLKSTSYTVQGVESERRFFPHHQFNSFFIDMMRERGTIKVGDQFELSAYDMTPSYIESRLEDEMERYQLGVSPGTSVFDDVYDLDVAVNTRSSTSLVKVSLMQSVLREIHRLGERHEISVLFVLIPSATDLIVEPVIDYKDLKANYESYMRVNLTRPLTQYLQRSKFPVINLFPGFYRTGAESLYDSENPLMLSPTGITYISDRIIDAYLVHRLK
jgi:hypothetical protein